jgi:hypothetical protein
MLTGPGNFVDAGITGWLPDTEQMSESEGIEANRNLG